MFLGSILTLFIWLAYRQRRLRLRVRNLEEELRSWQNDALTGLLSRRMFMERAKRFFGRVRRNLFIRDGEKRKTDKVPLDTGGRPTVAALLGRQLTIVFSDIDKFKRVNDSYGHLVGDQVLAAFGDILLSHVREDDVAGRYGGEEFALVLATDIFGAQAVIRRLRQSLSETMFVADDGTEFFVTFSAGVVTFDEKDQTLAGLLKRADELLYRAKKSGRNCYCVLENDQEVIYRK